jgi:Ca2+-binding RTX toxin-like protein
MRRLSFASALQGIQTVPAPARPVEIAPGIDYRLGRGATDMVVTGGDAAGRCAMLTGNSLDNTITGSLADETIRGLAGNDTIVGGGGRDTLRGGSGNDVLVGGDGADRLIGGDGNDVLVGGGGNDVLSGGAGNDVLAGGAGRNHLIGGAGDDVFSSNGPARVNGGTGIDYFRNDTTGGWRFVYTSAADSTPEALDVYDNFRAYDPARPRGHDLIDLSAVDADSTKAGAQPFTLVGGPTGQAGELWLVRGGFGADAGYSEFSWIMGDVNGDGVADLEIHLPTIIWSENLIL